MSTRLTTTSGTQNARIITPPAARRWFSREPLDDRFVKAVVENAVGG